MKSAAAIKAQRRVAGEHLVKPWRCSSADAIYCPIHHDCICPGDPFERRASLPGCPLHGVGTTHPTAVEVVR